ncbi:MAG: hypothetical protein HDR88_18770 [Bacteroides sp.]|nr:hypothetical protein [Bacteroides sp.]
MRHILFKTWTTVLLLGSIFSSCSKDDNICQNLTPRERVSIELTEPTRAVASDLTGFYGKFTADIVNYATTHPKAAEEGNVVASPISMAMLLAMVANGVAEEQRQAFTEYLGTEDLNSLNSLCKVLLEQLPKTDNLAKLQLANSVWVDSGANKRLREDYASIISNYYDAPVLYETFDDQKTVDRINGWCKGKTNGLIPNFLQKSPEGVALLINALYFHALWEENIFDLTNTARAEFYGDNCQRMVDMMQSAAYRGLYANDGEFELFTIPFGNSALQMEIIVPTSTVTDEGNALSVPDIETLSASATTHEIVATVPKFTVNGKYDISRMFEAVGKYGLVKTDVSMFDDGLQEVMIQYAHATKFTIDETGAEAASVSDDEIRNSALIDDEAPVYIKVDHPFWFFVREFSTGACILSGRIANL